VVPSFDKLGVVPSFDKLTMAPALGIHAQPEGRILSPSKDAS